MDGLSAASSVIAVVQLAGTVWVLCSDYLKEAKNAKKDIERLQGELAELETVLKGAQNLLNEPNADKLLMSQKFRSELENCSLQLHDLEMKLEKKPETRKRDKIRQSWGFRSLKWPFESKDIDEIVRSLFKFRETFSTSLNVDQTTLLLQSFSFIDSEEQLRILDWISSEPYGKHHRTVKEIRTVGTCEWLLQHEKFCEWENSNSSAVLWLQGSPGAGKTFLASRVIDHAQSRLEMSPNQGFAFFYCNRNETGRREPLSILKSYVRQLSTATNISGRIRKGLKDLYHNLRAKGEDIGFDTCREQLHEAVNLYDNTIIVLDALDECEPDSRLRIIDIIDSLLSQSKKVNFFLSSRGDRDIRNKFSKFPNIEIQASNNKKDIQSFVESEISNHQNWKEMSSSLKQDIVSVLLENSEEMFQWVYLQIKQILDLESEEAIRDRLGKLPSGLKATYDEIYGEIKGRHKYDKALADRAFMWVMSACEPLIGQELLSAIRWSFQGTLLQASEITESQLLHLCNNLLVLDSQRKVWRFSHLSVAEYFEKNYWTRQQAHCWIAKICLAYLIDFYSPPKAQNKHDDKDDWLAHYSKDHWATHVQTQEEEEPDPVLRELLKTFLGSPQKSTLQYREWCNEFRLDRPEYPVSPTISCVWAMCYFSFYTLLSDWWESADIPLLEINNFGDSLLSFAARRGYRHICELLIKRGMDVNLQDRRHGSALTAAAVPGNIKVVRYLIEHGADVNLPLQVGRYGSALTAAAAVPGNIKVVRYLIEHGADVNLPLQVGRYGSALTAAASSGNIKVVRYLIEHGADVNLQLQVGDYGSALTAAAAVLRNIEVVPYLIEHGPDVNLPLQVGIYGSALTAAAASPRNIEVVRYLVEHGADVNLPLQVGRYGSALTAAAAVLRNIEVVRYLIKHGADVNLLLQVGIYGSPLAAASFFGNIEVVNYLIEQGADVSVLENSEI